MSAIRPEVLKFAQLINDAIDRQERWAAENRAFDFWRADKPDITLEFETAARLAATAVAGPWPFNVTREHDFVWCGYLLAALAKSWGVLDAAPAEQGVMAMEAPGC